jgi:pilus assembly protein Flp/PilA
MMRTPGLRSIITPVWARFIADERGATAIEYAMIAAGIGVAISATVFNVGSAVKSNLYDKIAAAFN